MEDDRAEAKVESESEGRAGHTGSPPGSSTLYSRLAMNAAAGETRETGEEKKAEVGVKEQEEAHQRFADRLALKMSGEGSRTSSSASSKGSNISGRIRDEGINDVVPEKTKIEADGRAELAGFSPVAEAPQGSTFETRLAMKAAAVMKKESGTEKKVEVGAKDEEEAHRRFADRLASKMSGEGSRTNPSRVDSRASNIGDHIRGEEVAKDVPEMAQIQAEEGQGWQTAHGAHDPSSLGENKSTPDNEEGPRNTSPEDDCDDLEMAESPGPFEDRARAVRISDVMTEMAASSQQSVISDADTQDSGGPRVGGRRRTGGPPEGGWRRSSTLLHWLRSNIMRNVSGSFDTSNGRRSTMTYDSSNPVEAVLVHEASVRPADPVEVYEAKEISFFERRGGILFSMLCIVSLATALVVSLSGNMKEEALLDTTLKLTPQPTLSPTFDYRPTLEVIQTRPTSSGGLRCGFFISDITLFRDVLCSAIAAVVLGDPSAYDIFDSTPETRWIELDSRRVDLLLSSAHTVERETREVGIGRKEIFLFEFERVKSYTANFYQPSSQKGFAFSQPYYYAGKGDFCMNCRPNNFTTITLSRVSAAAYIGLNETLVRCAEKKERFGDCRSLYICVSSMTTHETHIRNVFPSDFYVSVNREAKLKDLLNGTCNVIYGELAFEKIVELEKEAGRDAYLAGDPKLIEPHAVVTRSEMANDREFGDIVTWTIMALIYGEAHNITKDPSKCRPYEELPTNPADLDYMKAVHCVGNYGEIFSGFDGFSMNDDGRLFTNVTSMNRLNTGQAMMREIPFGDMTQPPPYGRAVGRLDRVRDSELRCGVFVPDNFNSTLEESRGLVGLNVEFCMAVSAAALNGDVKRCILVPFLYSDKDDAYRALNNGTVDLIAGALWEFKYDFRSSDDLAGVHFSTPYFYGNESSTEGLGAYTLATMEGTDLFSSFVNCVVVAMMWALRRQITREFYLDMPHSYIFGR